jgi:hypothetical protein
MEEDKKDKAQQAMQSLKERLEQPSFLPSPLATDEQYLAQYLVQTQDIEMPESHRLIAFATFMSNKLSWKQSCEVYEYILLKDAPEERNGTFAVWITKTEDLLSDGLLSEGERTEIAQDLVSIIDRALADTPQNAGLALSLGTIYLKEAAHRDGDTEYVSQSVTWLNRAMEWLPAQEEQDQVQKYMRANINLRLGQCYMLLRVYKLALEHLNRAAEGNVLGEQEHSELISGITRCNLELSAQK